MFSHAEEEVSRSVLDLALLNLQRYADNIDLIKSDYEELLLPLSDLTILVQMYGNTFLTPTIINDIVKLAMLLYDKSPVFSPKYTHLPFNT
jgi:hypothetical protein